MKSRILEGRGRWRVTNIGRWAQTRSRILRGMAAGFEREAGRGFWVGQGSKGEQSCAVSGVGRAANSELGADINAGTLREAFDLWRRVGHAGYRRFVLPGLDRRRHRRAIVSVQKNLSSERLRYFRFGSAKYASWTVRAGGYEQERYPYLVYPTYCGNVTELGGCLLVGRWSRVGEFRGLQQR